MHGANFALNDGFNSVRNFIRYEHGSATSFVRRIKEPLLHEGEHEARQRGGHLILVDWKSSGTGVISRVSFFYILSYEVFLGHYNGLLIPLARVHYFDLLKDEVVEGEAISKLSELWIPPPKT